MGVVLRSFEVALEVLAQGLTCDEALSEWMSRTEAEGLRYCPLAFEQIIASCNPKDEETAPVEPEEEVFEAPAQEYEEGELIVPKFTPELAGEAAKIPSRCEDIADYLAEQEFLGKIKLDRRGGALVKAFNTGGDVVRIAQRLREDDKRGRYRMSADILELVDCLLGPEVVMPKPVPLPVPTPGVPAPPPPSALGYIVEFRCGGAPDCIPADAYFATYEQAQPPAANWIAAGGGRTARIRPRRPGEEIRY